MYSSQVVFETYRQVRWNVFFFDMFFERLLTTNMSIDLMCILVRWQQIVHLARCLVCCFHSRLGLSGNPLICACPLQLKHFIGTLCGRARPQAPLRLWPAAAAPTVRPASTSPSPFAGEMALTARPAHRGAVGQLPPLWAARP